MASFDFNTVAGTTIVFDPATDTLAFADGNPATGLMLSADGADTLVAYGAQAVRLAGVLPGAFGGTQFQFADGSIYRQGGGGNNSFTGTAHDDQFELSAGGNDTVAAGDGNDLIRAGATLTAADHIDGGAGSGDQLRLYGNYASTVVLGATTVTGVEQFVVGAGGTVRLQLNDGVFSSTTFPVSFDASAQGQTDAFFLDGSGVTASVVATGGAGADTLLGGASGDSLAGGVGSDSLVGGNGDDTLRGGLDADTLTGGAGHDRFAFDLGTPRTDASPTTIDTVTDFSAGDLLDLPGVNSINGLALVFNTAPLDFDYTGGSSGTQDFVHANDGFVDVYWRDNVAAGRLEVWVDGNDDGLFSETDLLIYLPNTATGKASITFADFVDNFVAWRGTPGDDSYLGNASDNQAFALEGNDTLAGAAGDDQLYGGEGNDSVAGDAGNDTVHGGSGADTLAGGDGNDLLYAEGQNNPSTFGVDADGTLNVLSGDAGNDQLQGGHGNDSMDGGDDDDLLDGVDGNDTLAGGTGADTLYGGLGNDSLVGGSGNDSLYSGWSGFANRDTLVGGDGDDVLYGQGDQVVMTGGAGADRFAFTYAASDGGGIFDFVGDGFSPVSAPGRITDFDAAEGDLLRSGISNGMHGGVPLVWRGTAAAGFTATVGESMALAGSDPSDTRFLELWTFYDAAHDQTVLFMDRNRDGVVGSDDFKLVFDGHVALDADSFTAGTFTVKIGTPGDDIDTTPPLTLGADLAFGLGGDDMLNAMDGNDTVSGDAGRDTLFGGVDDDRLYGGADNDSLVGDAGTDVLYGGSGADTLDGGDGADQLYADGYADSTESSWSADPAGTGNVLHGGFGDDYLAGGAGADQLHGDNGDDTAYGGAGDDVVDGGDGSDTLHGDTGNDSLSGGDGSDQIYSGYSAFADTDTLVGGNGDDVLYGQGDEVVMTGGAGADRFAFTYAPTDGQSVFNFLADGFSTVDHAGEITDFDAGEGDLLRSGIANGTWNGVPLAWRGTAAPGFTATVGQSMTLAGSDPADTRFLEFWTFYDAVEDQTVLFVDRNRDGVVDGNDFKIVFDGNVPLSPAAFTAGTFTAKVGTAGADTDTAPPLTTDADLAFGLGGNDTLSSLAGDDTLNGDGGDDQLAAGDGEDRVYGGTGADWLSGDTGSDTMYGGAGADILYGSDGEDHLCTEGFSDSTESTWVTDAAGTVNMADGGAGNDLVVGGAGDDQLYGNLDDDQVYGSSGNDLVDGGDGNDTLYGETGSDSLVGGTGDDRLYTGYSAFADTDTLDGGDGDDVLYAQGDRAVLTGGAGADRFAFTYAASDGGSVYDMVGDGFSTVAAPGRITDFDAAEGDLLRSGIGNGTHGGVPLVWRGTAAPGFTATIGQSMTLAGSDPADTRFLEFWTFYDAVHDQTVLFMDRNRDGVVDGNDLKIVFDGNVALSPADFTAGTFLAKVGTAGNDTDTTPPLSAGADLAFGLAGDDTLAGLDGNDSISGDAGSDHLSGGLDDDRLYGGADGDALAGDAGHDTLYGGAGADTLTGGDDADLLHADGYVDSSESGWSVDAAGTVNVLHGGAGNDVLEGGAGDDQLYGDADDDAINGGGGNDVADGGDGADTVHGDAGNDSVIGGAGDDRLYTGWSDFADTDTLVGGDGDDVLYAQGDRAVLTGGAGADRFAFTYASSDGQNVFDFVGDRFSNVSAPGEITDFDAGQGDLLRSGISSGLHADVPLVWRGTAAPGFTATLGQSLALAGADAADPRFLEFWTFYDAVHDQTVLYMDRNRDFMVDADDLKIVFDGNVPLSPASFTAGTFRARLGTSGNDTEVTLAPTDGDDMLLGGRGNDALEGGDGNDTPSGNQGSDTLAGDAGADHLLGGADNDVLNGGTGDDRLYGGTGSDTLQGGAGNDSLYGAWYQDTEADPASDGPTVGNRLSGGDGNDYIVGDAGADTLSGGGDNDWLEGGGGADQLDGDASDDTLIGGDGNDTLDGGDGNDSLRGDAGDDTYALRSGDTITEDAGGGRDTVRSYLASYTLDAQIENAQVMAATGAELVGNDQANALLGAAGADTLRGGAGADSLDGGAGVDRLEGGTGNDTYGVRETSDQVVEAAGAGRDTVMSYAAVYTLAANVEDGVVMSAGGASLTGNTGDNQLTGGAGNDSLNGGSGDDTLQGGAGGDRLAGGSGNDTYYVDDAGDVVVETSATGGRDTVVSTVTRTLGSNQEVLRLAGTAAIDGTGNALANLIDGNDRANVLDGRGGADTLRGGNGNDTYMVDAAGDQIVETATGGLDTVVSTVTRVLGVWQENLALSGAGAIDGTGNGLANVLWGNDAANSLDGRGGNDTLRGGNGNDTYYVDSAGDVVVESGDLAHGGIDTVVSQVTRTLGLWQENLVLGGRAAIGGTGNGLANRITGNGADNLLAGGAGNDSLLGGAGGDTLAGSTGRDVLTGGTGHDVFYYGLLRDTGVTAGTRDLITDFSLNTATRAGDTIDLASLDANTRVAGNQAFTFIGTAAFTGAGQLRYAVDATTGNVVVYGNTDADAAAEFSIELAGVTRVSAMDFQL